jgi:chaperonin GroES
MAKAKKTSKSIPSVSRIPIHPLHDRVVIKPLSPEEMGTTTASGIIIPDSAQEKPEQGTVIAVGPGKYEEGMRVPMSVKVGDRVMFSKYGYDEVKINGIEYFIVAETNILAVLN